MTAVPPVRGLVSNIPDGSLAAATYTTTGLRFTKGRKEVPMAKKEKSPYPRAVSQADTTHTAGSIAFRVRTNKLGGGKTQKVHVSLANVEPVGWDASTYRNNPQDGSVDLQGKFEFAGFVGPNRAEDGLLSLIIGGEPSVPLGPYDVMAQEELVAVVPPRDRWGQDVNSENEKLVFPTAGARGNFSHQPRDFIGGQLWPRRKAVEKGLVGVQAKRVFAATKANLLGSNKAMRNALNDFLREALIHMFAHAEKDSGRSFSRHDAETAVVHVLGRQFFADPCAFVSPVDNAEDAYKHLGHIVRKIQAAVYLDRHNHVGYAKFGANAGEHVVVEMTRKHGAYERMTFQDS
jgi:hypothetical protein